MEVCSADLSREEGGGGGVMIDIDNAVEDIDLCKGYNV